MDKGQFFEILVLLGALQYKIASLTKEEKLNTITLNGCQKSIIH